MSPRPYYEAGGVTLYLGDAREVLPCLELQPASAVVVTDPVWPNAPAGMFPGVTDAAALFAHAAAYFPVLARRVVVHLGCMSDPRFLSAVPASLPFVRACWLRLALPGNHGTILNTGDVAYVFGSAEGPEGRTLIPGEVTASRRDLSRREHPCPRKLEHVQWLVQWLTRQADTVLDPFAGSGTTLLAARYLGRRAVGVEVSERYAEVAARRLSDVLPIGLTGGAA